jgi:chromosomal replication initiator protein
MDLLLLWEQSQPDFQALLGESTYQSWFSSISVKQKNLNTLVIETPDEFFENWFSEHYLDIIKTKLSQTCSSVINIELAVVSVSAPQQPVPTKNSPESKMPIVPKKGAPLNPRFSFDNFVVGPSNRFAYSACLAVAESPGKAYNPLFIYGPVGLGKTHLMQSITHQIQQNFPQQTCYYLSSEKFTNELIDSIRNRSTSAFRNKYRNIDVLLIDDVSFIAGKESTQEEFFHTFNALHNNHKQIIISSDRPPKEIANLEERLSSRFAWGLIADIQPPDFETRVAILHKKIEKESVDVPLDVISFIAEQIKTNIRELEGALIRVLAYSLLEEKQITLDMAKIVLKDMVKETVKIISVEMIQKTVAEFYHIPIAELKAKNRSRNILLPRQVAMFLSRKLTSFSLPEIGSSFGGKDHTTVLHSLKKIELSLQENSSVKKEIDQLTILLKQ